MSEKISVSIITFNEEAKIRDALESVRWADEIVVVDSYSTDRTVEICKEYTDKIHQKEFIGFGGLKNLSVDLASNKWVLNLDSDERVSDELRREIQNLLKEGFDADGYAIPRKNFFLGRWIKRCGWYPDYRSMQLFNKERGRFTDDLVHERFSLKPGYKKDYLKEHIIQFPFLDLNQFFYKNLRYSRLRAEEMIRQGRSFRLHQVLTHPIFMFIKVFCFKRGFMDGWIGFMISISYFFFTFVKYSLFWEMTRSKK